MANKTKSRKSTKCQLIPLHEAMSVLKDFAHHVVFGNPETRELLFDYIYRFPKEADIDLFVDYLLEVVVQDEDYRIKMAEELNDNPISKDILETAYEIRAVLGFDALDEFMNEIKNRMEAEENKKLNL